MIRIHIFEKIKPFQLTDSLLDKESTYSKSVNIFGVKVWGYTYTRSFDMANQTPTNKIKKVGFMGTPIQE